MIRTNRSKFLRGLYVLSLMVAVLMLLRASPASARQLSGKAVKAATLGATCLQDVYGSKKLVCTANDVTVTSVDNIRGLDGKPLTSCTPNVDFTFIGDFHVTTSATSRQNIGIYFQTAGGSNALAGTCSDNIIGQLHDCPMTTPGTLQCGSSTYTESDAAPDNCGDTTSAHPEVVTIEVTGVKCQAAAGTTSVALPYCTSWQQPNGAILCESSPPLYPWVPAAIPGTVSKCSCNNGFTVPIAVQSPAVSVSKSCTVPGQTAQTSCTMSDPGGTVTYNVTVTNDQSNFGSVALKQICDSQYGTIATAAGYAGTCPNGTIANSPASTTCSLPQTIAYGGNYPCSFTANQGENSDVTNIATAKGVGADGTTPFSQDSNSVEVTVDEASSTATTTKSFAATKAGCATVRYGVDVHNTSGADESLSLTALTDDQVDITTVSGTILGTTCGVANGTGTLSGTAGAGTLSATIAVGGHYICQFDRQFCSALDVDGCISHTDTVTPTLSDDGEGNAVSNTGGSLTVKECFTASTP
jgi:hypothetical protein